jgi:hypothetical protein
LFLHQARRSLLAQRDACSRRARREREEISPLSTAHGPDGPPPVPRVTLVLMAIFVIGGSVGLTLDWPPGPANVNWGVWLLIYGGYAYVIGAVLFFARTGR